MGSACHPVSLVDQQGVSVAILCKHICGESQLKQQPAPVQFPPLVHSQITLIHCTGQNLRPTHLQLPLHTYTVHPPLQSMFRPNILGPIFVQHFAPDI